MPFANLQTAGYTYKKIQGISVLEFFFLKLYMLISYFKKKRLVPNVFKITPMFSNNKWNLFIPKPLEPSQFCCYKQNRP